MAFDQSSSMQSIHSRITAMLDIMSVEVENHKNKEVHSSKVDYNKAEITEIKKDEKGEQIRNEGEKMRN